MNKQYMITVGQRIRWAREHSCLTQEKLAEIIGVSRTAISRWELGEIDPTIEHLIALSQTLDVSADYLLGTGGKTAVFDMLMEMASILNRLVSDLQSDNNRTEKDKTEKDV